MLAPGSDHLAIDGRFVFLEEKNGMQWDNRPLESGTRIRYLFDRREFVGVVIQAGFYSIWVRVENSITEHFIRYDEVLKVLKSTK